MKVPLSVVHLIPAGNSIFSPLIVTAFAQSILPEAVKVSVVVSVLATPKVSTRRIASSISVAFAVKMVGATPIMSNCAVKPPGNKPVCERTAVVVPIDG